MVRASRRHLARKQQEIILKSNHHLQSVLSIIVRIGSNTHKSTIYLVALCSVILSSMSMNTDILLPAAVVSAAMGVAALGLLQTDLVSRLMLNPTGLQIKRKQEYAYRWQTALEKAHLQQSYYLAGGVSQVHEDEDYLAKQTDYLSQPEELETLMVNILNSKETRVQILKIDTDPHDTTGEYYLHLLERAVDQKSKPRIIQVPLATFGLVLHKAFDEQLTATTLCFVADASSGKATNLLEQLVQESKTGVAVISEPLWMATLAKLVDQHLIASRSKMEKILFGLCRLEAWSVRDQTQSSKTVMITLPGQATTPVLLPLLQTVFPEDRHVFAYDGCVASVQRGMWARRNIVTRGKLANNLSEVVSLSNDPIRHTTPFCQTSLTKSIHGLKASLAKVPVAQAEVVESWMTSVDAFLALKEAENTNGYLPYVFKLGHISGKPYSFSSESSDDSYWSLCSLLQYITGCRSRPLPEGTIDAAAEWLKDHNRTEETKSKSQSLHFSETERKNMENCVFQHKSILIGNKTLQDTVLPRQHWTLKQAAKNGGCSCCGPEEEEEEEEEDDKSGTVEKDNGMDTMNGNGGLGGGYVDGKMGFAFDPTKFS